VESTRHPPGTGTSAVMREYRVSDEKPRGRWKCASFDRPGVPAGIRFQSTPRFRAGSDRLRRVSIAYAIERKRGFLLEGWHGATTRHSGLPAPGKSSEIRISRLSQGG
jgi:hypothetical protein